MKPESRAPLIVAIALLLMPLLYVGSYLALVVPQSGLVLTGSSLEIDAGSVEVRACPYRFGGAAADWLFYPLEQIDRKLRRGAWDAQFNTPYSPEIQM